MAVSSARDDGKHLILLGTHDVYIHSVLFDPVARTLEQVGKKEISQDPSWLTKHPSVSRRAGSMDEVLISDALTI
jgi:hypothetical protein